MTDSTHVLDVLQERGYMPHNDTGQGEQWFDLISPDDRHIIRAVLTDAGDSEIMLLTAYQVFEWSATFRRVPGSVFLASLDAAEREAGIVRDKAGPAGEAGPFVLHGAEEAFTAALRNATVGIIGIVDGMPNVDLGAEWDCLHSALRGIRDELCALLPENADEPALAHVRHMQRRA